MTLFPIYIIAFIASISAMFYMLMRFWNPNTSKLFKNAGIRNFLFDWHWYFRFRSSLKKKSLFIVFGFNSNQLFKEILEDQGISTNGEPFDEKNRPYEILEIESVNYVFINEELLTEEKNFSDIPLLRVKRNLKRIAKLRRNILIDGVIFIPNQNAFKQSITNVKEVSEEALKFSTLYRNISSLFKAQLPLFFIEYKVFTDLPPIESVPSSSGDPEKPYFGFAHKTFESSEELGKEIKKAYDSCITAYEYEMQYYLKNLEPQFQGRVIQFFYDLKSTLLNFSKNYSDYFYKNFDHKTKRYTNFHYIINSISLENTSDPSQTLQNSLISTFKHISLNLVNGSLASEELEKSRLRKLVFIGALTLLHFIFATYAIFSSNSYIKDKRNIFLKSFNELNNFVTGYNKIENYPNNSNLIQNKICSLILNSNKLESTSFHYSMLFPSWGDTYSKSLTNKYNINLAEFISKIFIQNFNAKVASHLAFSKINEEQNPDYKIVVARAIEFVTENKKINEIYNLLASTDKQKNIDAITKMAYLLYGIDCGRTLTEKNVFGTLDAQKVSSLINPNYNVFKTQSIENFNTLSSIYFESFSSTHEIILAAQKLEGDLLSIKDINNSAQKHQDIPFSNRLSSDIDNLEDTLLKRQGSLKDSLTFYGTEFAAIISQIKENPLFGKSFSDHMLSVAANQFEQFKTKVSSYVPLGSSFPIIIQANNVYSVNPALSQLKKSILNMSDAFNNAAQPKILAPDNKQFSGDMKFISTNLPENALWSIDSLQELQQKGTTFQTAYAAVNQTLMPPSLGLFFRNLAESLGSQFWNYSLPMTVKIFDINSQSVDISSVQLDPYIQNIQMSAPILKSISDQLTLFKQSDLNSYVSTVLRKQMSRQMKKYSDALNSSSYFQPIYPDFNWWEGDVSPANKAFAVTSEEDLKVYVTNQKAGLDSFFNKNILPILQARLLYFKDNNIDSYTTDSYVDNLLTLQDALSPTPKVNTLAILSGFLLNSVNPLRIENCSKFISQPPSTLAQRDFFSFRLNSIYQPLQARCQNLLIRLAYSNYDKFADNFNAALSAKFPFVSYRSQTQDTASLEDLTAIINDYNLLKKQDLPILQKYSSQFKNRGDIQRFLKDFEDVSLFFPTQLDKDGNPTTIKYSIDFEYRTNIDRENLVSQIINWSLQSGTETIGSELGLANNKAKLQWGYTDPIQFILTIANSSKYSLDKFADDKNVFVTNNTIYFNIRNRWSLIKFINDYADCTNRELCLRNSLKFELPINNDQNIILFVSLNLRNAKGARIYVPNFPINAPYLEGKPDKKVRKITLIWRSVMSLTINEVAFAESNDEIFKSLVIRSFKFKNFGISRDYYAIVEITNVEMKDKNVLLKYNLIKEELNGKFVDIEFKISPQNGENKIFHFYGYITKIKTDIRTGSNKIAPVYTFKISSPMWYLKKSNGFRTWNDKSTEEVLKDVFKAHEVSPKFGIELDLSKSKNAKFSKRMNVIQHGESDYNFIARICNEDCLSYFYVLDQDKSAKNKITLVITDDLTSSFKKKYEKNAAKIEGYLYRKNYIDNSRYIMKNLFFYPKKIDKLPLDKYSAFYHDERNFSVIKNNESESKKTLKKSSWIRNLHLNKTSEEHTDSLNYHTSNYLNNSSKLQSIYKTEVVTANPFLLSCFMIDEKGAIFSNDARHCDSYLPKGKFLTYDLSFYYVNKNIFGNSSIPINLIEKFKHFQKPNKINLDGLLLRTFIKFLPVSEYVFLPKYTQKNIKGQLRAKVIPDDNDKKLPKIKNFKGIIYVAIKFLWPETSKNVLNIKNDFIWARLSQFWASKGFGALFVPEAEDEVLIYFDGDNDVPIIIASLYNSVNKTPNSLDTLNKGLVYEDKEFFQTIKLLTISEKAHAIFKSQKDEPKYIIDLKTIDTNLLSSKNVKIETEATDIKSKKTIVVATKDTDIKSDDKIKVATKDTDIKSEDKVKITTKDTNIKSDNKVNIETKSTTIDSQNFKLTDNSAEIVKKVKIK